MMQRLLFALANILSVLFHPLLLASYMLILAMLLNPFAFGFLNLSEGKLLLLVVFIFSFVLPGFAIFLLKQLGFVQSLQLQDKKERIAPLMISAVFYLWLLANANSNSLFPNEYSGFLLGAIITLFLCLFTTTFFKISLHAAGIGGVITMVSLSTHTHQIERIILSMGKEMYLIPSQHLFIALLLVAGMVGSSRLLLHAHKPKELYWGYAIGILGVILGNTFYPIFF
jgi:hypothetical protein